jgi:hypothetical protein
MKKRTMELLVEAALGSDCELEARESYSGRGMYGESTCAVIGDVSSVAFAAAEAGFILGQDADSMKAIEDAQDLSEDMRNLRTDNMGRSSLVIY